MAFITGDGETGPAEGAAYWASLLSDFAGNLRREEQDELNKSMRKRNRTEKAAALASKPDLHTRKAPANLSVYVLY